MARITKTLRGAKGSKRLDLSGLKDAMRDRRAWGAIGVVIAPSGAASHYEIVQGPGGPEDVLVEVELQPDRTHVSARLGALGGGPGAGLWAIPPVGAEVAVLIPSGRLDFMPCVVGVLSSGSVPERISAEKTILVAPTTLELVVGDRVIRVAGGRIDLGDEASQPVPKGNDQKSLLTDILNAIASHSHSSNGAPPNNAGTFTAKIAEIDDTLSDKVFTE